MADMKLRVNPRWLIFFAMITLHACAVGQAKHENVQQDTVCVTRTGKKYHDCTCRYLHSSSIPLTLSDALTRGYTACSVCDPLSGDEDLQQTEAQDIPRVQPQGKPASRTSNSSQQCSGITKVGLRCKRMTTSASGKCWQHE